MSDIEPLALRTADGVRLDAMHLPGDGDLAIVLAHGFTGGWRKPRTRRIAGVFRRFGGVIGFDFRGHGRSGGASTVGDAEVFDIAAAVDAARGHGYRRVAVVGFSMGAAVAIRYAGMYPGLAAVAAISPVAHWYYRGTAPMRTLHRGISTTAGRLVTRLARGTRVSAAGWRVEPLTPEALAREIAPTPLLIVQGDADRYFPLRHAHALYAAAGEPRELWIEAGMGHAESGTGPGLVRRVGVWLSNSARPTAVPRGA